MYQMKVTKLSVVLSLKVLLILTEFLPNDYLKVSLWFLRKNCAKHWRVRRCDFEMRNTTRPQLRFTVPLAQSNYAHSFNQSDYKNLRMRYIILVTCTLNAEMYPFIMSCKPCTAQTWLSLWHHQIYIPTLHIPGSVIISILIQLSGTCKSAFACPWEEGLLGLLSIRFSVSTYQK